MAIAYGGAMNKLTLHIPTTCPEDWRGLMEGAQDVAEVTTIHLLSRLLAV